MPPSGRAKAGVARAHRRRRLSTRTARLTAALRLRPPYGSNEHDPSHRSPRLRPHRRTRLRADVRAEARALHLRAPRRDGRKSHQALSDAAHAAERDRRGTGRAAPRRRSRRRASANWSQARWRAPGAPRAWSRPSTASTRKSTASLSERFYVSLWDTPIEGAFNWDWDPDGCEPLATFVHRAAHSVMRILDDDRPDGETVIVAHGGILLVACALTNATLEQAHRHNAVPLRFTRQNGAWTRNAGVIPSPMADPSNAPCPPARTRPAFGSDVDRRHAARARHSLHRAESGRELSRPARQPRQLSRQCAPQMLLCLHEESAVAIAHGYAKVTGTRDGGGGAFQRRADARHHGDLQRLVRPHAGARCSARPGRSTPPSAGRGSTGSTPRATRARWCAPTPNGTTSRPRPPPRAKR